MRPSREQLRQSGQTYFVTFQTARRQYLFRHERWSQALLETLQRYAESYKLHDFVIMPDHVHLLLSPNVPLEKAVQLVKGGFGFYARRNFAWKADIWQAGFSDHRIRDFVDWQTHLEYIAKNVRSLRQDEYRFCGSDSALALQGCPPWLKPLEINSDNGGAKAPPLRGRKLSP